MTANPKHMTKSQEWYTPQRIVEASREYLGIIDLDPASSLLANEIVQAKHFYTNLGLSRPWFGRVFLNPPGGRHSGEFSKITKSEATAWYLRLCQAMLEGHVEKAIFVGFTLEILQTVQVESLSALLPPFVCIFPRRVQYYRPSPEDPLKVEVAPSPPHGSCVIGFGPSWQEFLNVWQPLGLCFRSVRQS